MAIDSLEATQVKYGQPVVAGHPDWSAYPLQTCELDVHQIVVAQDPEESRYNLHPDAGNTAMCFLCKFTAAKYERANDWMLSRLSGTAMLIVGKLILFNPT